MTGDKAPLSFPVKVGPDVVGIAYVVHNGWHAMHADLHGMSDGLGWNGTAYDTRAQAEAALREYHRKKGNV